MSVKAAVLPALLCALWCALPAAAQDYETIFNGTVGDRRVVAVTVSGDYVTGDLIDDLSTYAGPRMTLLAYADEQEISETEPLAVYVDGYNTWFAQRPRTASDPPTLADTWQQATIIERGERNGALCRDGSRTDMAHSGACTFNGGVERWLYEAFTRTDAEQVVAAICKDYRLVAGNGRRCGDGEVLAHVYARLYSELTPAEPFEEPEPEEARPNERAVAPLPEPAVAAPVVDDSKVEWTERKAGAVGFVWSTSLSNANAQPVRAVVTVALRDAEDEIIHRAERVIALEAGERGEFTDTGSVEEDVAVRGRRWTFDVRLAADDDAPLTDAEAGTVRLVVDPLIEEARITNTGDTELDLNGWTLTSSVGGESFTFRFFKLGAGTTVTLSSGEGARSLLPGIYLWTSREVWDDGGDVGELRDARGRLRALTNPDGSAASIGQEGSRRASR